jgi:hypothetical protein
MIEAIVAPTRGSKSNTPMTTASGAAYPTPSSSTQPLLLISPSDPVEAVCEPRSVGRKKNPSAKTLMSLVSAEKLADAPVDLVDDQWNGDQAHEDERREQRE